VLPITRPRRATPLTCGTRQRHLCTSDRRQRDQVLLRVRLPTVRRTRRPTAVGGLERSPPLAQSADRHFRRSPRRSTLGLEREWEQPVISGHRLVASESCRSPKPRAIPGRSVYAYPLPSTAGRTRRRVPQADGQLGVAAMCPTRALLSRHLDAGARPTTGSRRARRPADGRTRRSMVPRSPVSGTKSKLPCAKWTYRRDFLRR
jgi:hypothetical protein